MNWHIKRNRLNVEELINEESLFFLGNGYLGVRGNFEEGYPDESPTIRGTYINAFHDIIDIPYGEKLYGFPDTQQKMLNVQDTQSVHIYLGEEEELYTLEQGQVLNYSRKLLLDEGSTAREIYWKSPLGKELNIRFERLVSFVHRELFMIKLTLIPVNFSGKLKVVSSVSGDVENYVNEEDPRVATGEAKRLHLSRLLVNEDVGYIESQAEVSRLLAGCMTRHYTDVNAEMSVYKDDHSKQLLFEYVWEAEESVPASLTKRTIFVDSLRHEGDLYEAAIQLQQSLEDWRDDELFHKQKEYMVQFWRHGDVRVGGDFKLQEGLRFNLYHLLQSVGRDSYSNISAKGLSGEGYEGHYFWDTEIYMFPVFLMIAPDLARKLLIYRYSILSHAKNRAAEMGHQQGALFPWRTISGKECSSYFPAGTAQYHISADIAYSYIQYYQATGDTDFLLDYGVELLVETARLWMDVGHLNKNGFSINNVTGPDEYTAIVNNNYYTNVMAKHNLIWAVKAYQLAKRKNSKRVKDLAETLCLTKEELEEFKQAAVTMNLPYDSQFGINPQDDTFLNKAVWDMKNTPADEFPLLLHFHPLTLYRYQVCKQADTVLAHFLLEDEQDFETIRNSYNYYEKITTHDSSLSTCVFSMMAAKLGDLEKAFHYFGDSARLDLDNMHGNTKDGLHMANMAGSFMAIVFGFAGLRIKENGLHFTPKLPEQWSDYSFHVHGQGQLISACVTSQYMRLKLIDANRPVEVHVNGLHYRIKPDETLKVFLAD
ncbi:glycoside hydrolase family 65 protein [Halobacillus naozhouensis]|uniref:Glycosyl hydrolase family 65 protein n=1 Tax=Halobacillus naozhouensis TaxID=554880 RepID=A0ABY8IW78_9BACI|nr:glycosyl hydrolase family 65 protein [Halobacillus naozhouensis]WFT74460.1 glycosyl hydrolase family 65 protein [Halobacillus naozhouensis]